jgi:hypothetical protein
MNIANIQKLHYCDKKSSNTCTCSNLATRKIKLKNKSEKDNPLANEKWYYRCEEHALTPTSNKVVVDNVLFDQSQALMQTNQFLNTLIEKNIKSRVHTTKQLLVKYVKPNTGGVMCFQERSRKWKFVYYEQINEILD